MFGRQRSGSVVCPSCGRLVGVRDDKCFHCGRPFPGMWGFAPVLRRLGQDMGFLPLVMGACAVLYVATLAVDPPSQEELFSGGIFGFLAPKLESLRRFGASGAVPVLYDGRWWTVLSAGWLHGSLLHVGFNVYWMTRFAPLVAELYGPGRTVILYTTGSVAGFTLSTLAVFAPGPLQMLFGVGGFTVGASAALMGLLGALLYYGRRVSDAVGRFAWVYVIFFLVFGLLVRSTDNWAHLGGLGGGWLAAKVLNPLKAERGDHLVIAVLCLLASALAIVVSLLVAPKPI